MIRAIQLCLALLVIFIFDIYVYDNLPWVDDITRYKVNFQYPVVYALNSNLTTPIWGLICLFLLEFLDFGIDETIIILQYSIFISLVFILSFASKNLLTTLLLISSLFITYSLDMVIGNLRQGFATSFFIFSLVYLRGYKRSIGLGLSVLTHNMMIIPWYIYYIYNRKIFQNLSTKANEAIFIMPLMLGIIFFAGSYGDSDEGRSISGLLTYLFIYVIFLLSNSADRIFVFARGLLLFVIGTYLSFDQILRYMGSFMSVILLASKELSKEFQVAIISIVILSTLFLWALRLKMI